MVQRGNGEGSVYQEGRRAGRTDGRWIAQLMVDGRARRRIAPSQAAAKRALREMQAELARGSDVGHGNLTVRQLTELWQQKALPSRNLSDRTIHSYQWAIGVITEALGQHRASRLEPDDIERAFAKLAQEGRASDRRPMSRESLIKVRSVLSKILDWGMRRRYVPRNVARLAELPAHARRPDPGQTLTMEQARHLIATADDDRLGALWLTMLLLGLRPGEATGLLWTDVDLNNRIVHIRRSLKIGLNATPVVTEELKTQRSRRSLDAPPKLIGALRRHREAQSSERAVAGGVWNDAGLIFCTTIGTPLNPSNVRRALTTFLAANDLPRVSPNVLRHSFASLMSSSGVPLEHIADVMGHDGTRMTSRVYRHAVTPTVPYGVSLANSLVDHAAAVKADGRR
jgi:integrase